MTFQKGLSPWNKGKKTGLIPKTAFKKGHISWMKGMAGKGIIPWNKGLKLPYQTGEKHFAWKGNNVSYRTLHKWVERKLGKATKCMKDISHKSTRYHWANISQEYKRELTDWRQLCPSCNLLERKDRRVSL